jgi:hypothetical protein
MYSRCLAVIVDTKVSVYKDHTVADLNLARTARGRLQILFNLSGGAVFLL